MKRASSSRASDVRYLNSGTKLVLVPLTAIAAWAGGTACNDVTLELSELREGGESTGAGGEDDGGACRDELCAGDFCRDGVGECRFSKGELDCEGDVGRTVINRTRDRRSLIVVDMAHATELRLAFEICDPTDYVLNLGDSPSNDGGGGDAWDSSNDAEILIRDDGLHAYSNQLGYATPEGASEGFHPLLLYAPGYLAKEGCSVRTFSVGDQFIAVSWDGGLRRESPMALRINPSTDTEGTPDALWYLGINRVVSGRPDRVGGNVNRARLCFTRALPRACEHNGYLEPDPATFGYPLCPPTHGGWAGCGAHGCSVCADALLDFPRYRQNHPCCRPDELCEAERAPCNSACPEPTDADR